VEAPKSPSSFTALVGYCVHSCPTQKSSCHKLFVMFYQRLIGTSADLLSVDVQSYLYSYMYTSVQVRFDSSSLCRQLFRPPLLLLLLCLSSRSHLWLLEFSILNIFAQILLNLTNLPFTIKGYFIIREFLFWGFG